MPAVLGIVRDITQRKKQERKLHLADMVFQKTQEGIAITDAQRNILLSNPAFSVITEYNAEELLGVDIRSLYAEDKNSAVIREKQQSLKDAGLWQGALWKRRKSGEVYREWVVINAIYNEAGEIVQYIDISLDVSRIDHVETHMEYLAHHDALTDLPNRLLLHSRLEHTLELAKRNNEKCALMFMDLDSFKSINDTYGHGNSELPGVFFENLRLVYFGEVEGDRKILEFINLVEQALSACEFGYRTAPELLSELGQQATPIVTLLNRITVVYEGESKQYAQIQRKQHHELMESIQNIAKQARIVSVNAQIVAARAGEVGREFAVVAGELTNITAKIDDLVRIALGHSQV